MSASRPEILMVESWGNDGILNAGVNRFPTFFFFLGRLVLLTP